MKTLPCTLALIASSAFASEKPAEIGVIPSTQGRVQKIVSGKPSLDDAGVGSAIMIGSVLLGSAAASWADSEYRKRVPPEKRIGARVMRRLGEADNT